MGFLQSTAVAVFTLASGELSPDSVVVNPNSPNVWDNANSAQFCRMLSKEELSATPENINLAKNYCSAVQPIIQAKYEGMEVCDKLEKDTNAIGNKLITSGTGASITQASPSGKELSSIFKLGNQLKNSCVNQVSGSFDPVLKTTFKQAFPAGFSFPAGQ